MSMVLVFLFAILLILGFVFLIGLILLIVGIVKRTKPKNQGKKHPTVLIVIGSLLMVPLIGMIVFVAVYPGASDALKQRRMENYTSVREIWLNESIYGEKELTKQAIEAMVKASEEGDKESFKANFAEAVRNNSDFDKRVDDFFAAYPCGFDVSKFVERTTYGGYDRFEGTNRIREFSNRYLTTSGGEDFVIMIGYCCENDDHPEKVGITYFTVRNVNCQAVFELDFDPYDADASAKVYEREYLVCDLNSSNDFDARIVSGGLYLWTESDGPVLTKSQMADVLNGVSSLKEAIDQGLIGNPNVTVKSYNSSTYVCYYELKSDNGEPLYAHISLDSPLGSINSAYTCSKYEGNYSDSIVEK